MRGNINGYLSDYNLPLIGERLRYNEIDGLVLAIFSFAPIGPDIRRRGRGFSLEPIGKTMGELSCELIDTENNDLLNTRFGFSLRGDFGKHLEFFTNISRNNRYNNIKIVGFLYNNDELSQFSAFTFEILPGEYVIAFRGTDDSLEGWYESIKLFRENLPARQLALNYLRSEMKKLKGSFRLVGHSKGGHLAVAAAIMSDIKQKTNIRSVINYDGPGFTKEFIKKHYKSILLLQHKVYRFSPTDALVSSVLFGQEIIYYEKNMRYVKPYGPKVPHDQHLYFNWAINMKNRFELKKRSKLSVAFQKAADKVHNLYSLRDMDYILDQLYEQTRELYKDSENMMNRFDVLTIFLGATIKILAGSKKQRINPKL